MLLRSHPAPNFVWTIDYNVDAESILYQKIMVYIENLHIHQNPFYIVPTKFEIHFLPHQNLKLFGQRITPQLSTT
jgi:hypothetical protein